MTCPCPYRSKVHKGYALRRGTRPRGGTCRRCPSPAPNSRVRDPLSGQANVEPMPTRVKPEQASQVKMRMPTRLGNGEGRVSGEAIDTGTRLDPPGVRGTARWKGDAGHRGRPVSTGGWQPHRRTGGGSDGSRRGPYDRGGQVMLAEERALASGALWREPRIGEWR